MDPRMEIAVCLLAGALVASIAGAAVVLFKAIEFEIRDRRARRRRSRVMVTPLEAARAQRRRRGRVA